LIIDMKITVYTITDCPFCKQEKEFLTAQGLQFEEKNVQENRQFLTEMLDVSDKFAGVPFTLVEKDSGEKIGLKGFTQSEFEAALGLTAAAPAAPAAMSAAPVDMPAAPAPSVADPMPAPAPADPMTVAPAAPVDMPTTSTTTSMPDAAPNMPSMPGIDEAPAAPAPVTAAPNMPSAAPVEPAPANPQNQLDGLLADLQTKAQPDLPDFTAPSGPTVPAAPVNTAADPMTTPQQ
jgi:glutaredoxin